ncbi:MAG: sporulation protein, partial [Nitrospinaceae bacterium]|nr:sporulation protein [Nitrospinaceae bacterium]NIR55415.1 sporulation protein [Nitrospinaceae bacterium]NIS85855.1 sporulation protein [Nitrospinaceae bacterium]NIT82699.1 sporulation protein [Nitrospinaceae bacterium]NIU44908.1 sporulation protein [Nitrospinaceae bacterium]
MEALTRKDCPISEAKSAPRFLIGIRVKHRAKSELFDPGPLSLKVGTTVIVQTEDGPQIGVVASNKIANFRQDSGQTFFKVLRIANENDLQAEARKEKLERRAKNLCLDKIDELQLPMNLSRVVHVPQLNKTIFFFTAEGRVDFRQLIKELAANLRHRIEMKQVGVRDEARAIGGYGMCGETLCCSTFLKEFTPVTIRMAKDQGLALNPSKISGVCGRLMCCLQYEHETYRALIKDLPKNGARIHTP